MSNQPVAASIKLMALAITIVQLLDIVLHAATDQLEFIRVTSNLVILAWLATLFSSRLKNLFPISLGAIGTYLLLNAIFLAREGLYNIEQGGGLRVTLLILVSLTVGFSTLLIYRRNTQTI